MWMCTSPKPTQPPPDSPFGKFQVFMRMLVQVPKAELDRKLAQEQKRKTRKGAKIAATIQWTTRTLATH